MQRELSSWGLAAFAARYVLASRRVLLPSRPLLVLPSWDVATDGNAWPGSLPRSLFTCVPTVQILPQRWLPP